MPKYLITSPDGKKYEVTAPDGASHEDVLAKIQDHYEKSVPSRFLSGLGGKVLEAGNAVSELLPKLDNGRNYAKEGAEQGLNDATGFAGEAGKFTGAMIPYMALPGGVVRGALGSAGVAAATTPGDIENRSLSGLTTGLGTALMGGVGVTAKAAYDKIAPILFKDRGAAELIAKELMKTYVPKQAPTVITGQDMSLGVPTPKFIHVPGIKPTAGMITDNPGLLKMEMNARLRNPGGFFQRDNENAARVYNSIKDGAFDDSKANALIQELNNKTGPMRDDAFIAAEQNPIFRKEFADYINTKAQQPGVRETAAMPLINRAKSSLIMRPKVNVPEEQLMSSANSQRRAWHDSPVDTENDSMLTAITKLGGINKDMAQSTYGNKIWEDTPNGFNVFRNNGGQSLDDLSARLVEHGYLPEGSGPYDLVEAMYGNPREMFSAEKMDFGFAPEQGADDFLRERLDSLITVLGRKNAPKPKIERELEPQAMPQDIYAMRKELADKLRLNTLSPDELTNAAKSNRQVTHEIMDKADEALNNASGGKYGDYMSAYKEGIQPITEGRALQDIIEKFDTKKKIFGTNVPEITPHALRTAIDKETYYNAGNKGFQSTVGDQTRYILNDAENVMNAMEHAKKGVVAVNGSPSASFFSSLAQDGILKEASRNTTTGRLAMLIQALGASRGQRNLDDALLNPEKLQPILDVFHKLPSNEQKTKTMQMIAKYLMVPTAGIINE